LGSGTAVAGGDSGQEGSSIGDGWEWWPVRPEDSRATMVSRGLKCSIPRADKSGMVVLDIIQSVGAVATAVGFFLAWRELRQSEKQALTDFEDEFPREYRQLLEKLPTKALLGKGMDRTEYEAAKGAFFRYFDLCNEQVFLRQNARVSRPTWLSWCGGIRSNLELPAFAAAWSEIKSESRSFAELKRLHEANFKDNPIDWGCGHLEDANKRREAESSFDSDREAA